MHRKELRYYDGLVGMEDGLLALYRRAAWKSVILNGRILLTREAKLEWNFEHVPMRSSWQHTVHFVSFQNPY
jgi:hypothetical protein